MLRRAVATWRALVFALGVCLWLVDELRWWRTVRRYNHGLPVRWTGRWLERAAGGDRR